MKRTLTLLLLLLVHGCGVTRGIATDFRAPLKNASHCVSALEARDFVLKQDNVVFSEIVGQDLKCVVIEGDKSFYKAFMAESHIHSVLIRSFYALSGEKARVFIPKVYGYDVQNQRVTNGIIDHLDDSATSKDGQFLEVKYVFNRPTDYILIVSDRTFDDEDYRFDQRNVGGFAAGGAIYEYDFISRYDIAVNAGGPIDVILNPLH